MSIVDTISYTPKSPNRPKGYWIGAEVHFEDELWSIDIWLQKPDWVDAVQQDKVLIKQLAGLDQQSRDAILTIKYELISQNAYGSKFSSLDVYKAVLDLGIKTTEDFLNMVGVN